MFGSFINNIKEIKNNPHYFIYYWKNSHFLQSHFPELCRVLRGEKHKQLELGKSYNLEKLHVILRTTDYVMNINSSRNLEEMGVVTKNDVIRVGGCSLFNAGARFTKEFGIDKIRISLVTDRLSETGLSQYKEAASQVGLSFDVVDAIGHGNGPTFQTQINLALQDSDDTLVLILEDDYLLDEQSFATCFNLMRDHSNVVGMNPHFHPDRIRRQDIGKLAVIDGKLYSQVYNTCCTFFMPVCRMKKYEKFLRVYDGQEDGSINSIWEEGLCLAPIGWTLAEHLHRGDLSPVNRLFVK